MRKMTIFNKQFHYVSQAGLEALRSKLATIKNEASELRAKLVELRQVKDAEDFDLVDDTLKLAFYEKEAERMQGTIAHCKVVDPSSADGTAQIGSVVRLRATDANEEMSCVLVSSLEADPLQGKISDKSPLGNALLGKMKNAIVKVVAPHKVLSYRIVGIEQMKQA